MDTSPSSPRWGSTTKLVVALTLVALIAAMIVKFQNIISPLILAFTMVYLLYPAASFLNRHLRFSWGLSVSLIYLLVLVVLLGLLALGGFELVQQLQSLIILVQNSLKEIPGIIESLSQKTFTVGPFVLDMRTLDLTNISSDLLGSIEPLLGRTGNLIGTVASRAIEVMGWTAFILFVSYFILVESGGLREGIFNVSVPRYGADLQRLGQKLGRIWNAFLRGQLILITIAAIIYSILLSALGVRYAVGLAIMAGLARFLPYAGPAVNWTILALVTYFQDFHPFGLTPFFYMLTVLICAWIVDGILDSFVSPRIMAHSLKVHPAAVMIAAIIALELLGVLGVVIAAPILATSKLIGEYILRKLFDLDPWEEDDEMPEPPPLGEQLRNMWANLVARLARKPIAKPPA